jgi:putative transposase
MSSYRQILYHLVFRTKCSRRSLVPEHSRELYAYIMGVIKGNGCFLYRINGMEDHLHILCDLHPSVALADLVRDVKVSSSGWMKESGKFPGFTGWSSGYAALTYAWRDQGMIANYIKNQQEHHRKKTYEAELRKLLKEQGVKIDEKYFPYGRVQPLQGCCLRH